MKIEKIIVLGMELTRWNHKSCTVDIAEGDNWATTYTVESTEPGKGHATELLTEAKTYYESKNKKFGGTVALNEKMRRLYKKLEITEYK